MLKQRVGCLQILLGKPGIRVPERREMKDYELTFPGSELVCLARYRKGELEAFLPHVKLNGETMGEWCRRVVEIARTASDETVLMELADYYMFGRQEIHQALRENPATSLRVAETAVRNLRIFCENSWTTTAKVDLQAWEAKQKVLLSAACKSLTERLAFA